MNPAEWEFYASICMERDASCWHKCMELYGSEGIEAAAEAGYWWHHGKLLLEFRFIQRVYKTQYNYMYVHVNPPYQNWE